MLNRYPSCHPPIINDLIAGFQFDYVFDWTILKYQQSQLATPPARPLVSDITTHKFHYDGLPILCHLMMVSVRALVLAQALDCPLLLAMLTEIQVVLSCMFPVLTMNFMYLIISSLHFTL